MQVILLERVANLGDLGDIVNVKDGFGRNFLLPQGKAKRATEANKAEFEARRAELEKQQAAEKRAKDIAGFKLEVQQKAGVDGKLFGSVTNFDIAEALTAAGHKVEKAEIRMPDGPLKTLGEHSITIVLHHEVTTDINVVVSAEE